MPSHTSTAVIQNRDVSLQGIM